MIPAEKQITQLYVGMFGRAADYAGYSFWLAQANEVATLRDIGVLIA